MPYIMVGGSKVSPENSFFRKVRKPYLYSHRHDGKTRRKDDEVDRLGVNINVFSLGLPNATVEQQVCYSAIWDKPMLQGVYTGKYRVHLIPPTASGNA
jgi:hypothetical protein